MESIQQSVQESQDRIYNKAASRWAFVQGEVFDHADELGSIGIAVYAVLCRYASAVKRCFPSVPTIAKMAGCSETSAKGAIKMLSEKGLIVIVSRGTAVGKSSVYEITDFREKGSPVDPVSTNGVKVDHQRGQKLGPTGSPVDYQQQYNNNITTSDFSSSSSIEEQFTDDYSKSRTVSEEQRLANLDAIAKVRMRLKEKNVLKN